MPPSVRVREAGLYARPVKTRIPFKYGATTVLGEPIAHLRVETEVDGRPVVGVSAAALPPGWFDKSPGRTHEDDVRDQIRSIRTAADAYRGRSGTAFALHRLCEPEARRRLADLNDLTAGFGVALLDAALVDAVCRATRLTFHQALRGNVFGFGPVAIPERPLERIFVRHTVGMADPIAGRGTVGDGLPETLEEVVRAHGVRYFKVKVSGAPASQERLREIARVLDALPETHVTIDGNEQFHSMEDALEFARSAAADPALARLWERTIWIEQPVERGAALGDAVAAPLRELSRLKPVIVDESDGTDDAVDRALALGYAGISAKNCKGVWRTLHSFIRTRERNAILSSEDLMNTPVVPLHQDLAVAAALGIGHSERNGHHYIRAFEYFTPREREAALREFPSLYRADPAGVRVEDGALDLREVNAVGFGVRSEPDWDGLESLGAAG
jgi:hypothetical protein